MKNNFQNNNKQDKNNDIEKKIRENIKSLQNLFLQLKRENEHTFLYIIRDILNVNNKAKNSLEKLKNILKIYENQKCSKIIIEIIKTLNILENLFNILEKQKKNDKNTPISKIWEIPIYIQIQEFKELLKNSKLNKLNYKDLLSPGGYTECLAYKFKKTSTNQVRKIFETMKKIYKEKNKKYIYISYPLLAYAQGRKLIPEELTQIFQLFLEALEKDFSEENLKKFENFLIGLLGYLKKYAD